jgi:hypothetical protein
MKGTGALEQVCAQGPRLAAVEQNAEHESYVHPAFDLEVDALVAENRVAQGTENRCGRFDARVHVRVRGEGEVDDRAQVFELSHKHIETASLSPKNSPLPPMPFSSHTTS